MSGNFAGEQSPNVNERHPDSIDALAIDDSRGVYATPLRRPNWVAVLIIGTFWAAQFASFTTYSMMMSPERAAKLMLPRALISGLGLLLSFGLLAAQNRLQRSSLSMRAIIAALSAALGALLHAAINHAVFAFFTNSYADETSPLRTFVFETLDRLWIFTALAAIILALSYSRDIREREDQIHALQALAHTAQIRALRNQLNPHFLFNALNSIAGLISAKRVSEAETMTENLADFLRLTLAQDPQKPITLNEELQLQGLYLDIEQVRFPDRLDVKVDVPPDVRKALVPSLITQPLIENSIKYAVARSARPVELRIDAKRIGDQLELVVSDSGGDADANPSKHTQLGLSNVAERLRAHYGEVGRFVAEADPAGGFRNVITIPFQSQI